MGQTVVYVDGMNLYHGIKAKYGRKYLWTDLFAFAARLRRPDTIIRVRYFTTIVAGEPEAARRQETYLAARTSLRPQVEVVRSKFKVKKFGASGAVPRTTATATRCASTERTRRS